MVWSLRCRKWIVDGKSFNCADQRVGDCEGRLRQIEGQMHQKVPFKGIKIALLANLNFHSPILLEVLL